MIAGLKNVVVIGGSYVGLVSLDRSVLGPPWLWNSILTFCLRRPSKNLSIFFPSHIVYVFQARCVPKEIFSFVEIAGLIVDISIQVLLVEPHSHFHHLFAFVRH